MSDEPIEVELVNENDRALARRMEQGPLRAVMTVPQALERIKEFQSFCANYLVEGEDYGKLPGTDKRMIFKSGSEKLGEIYGLTPEYKFLSRTVDWTTNLFDFELVCELWRTGIKCPECGHDARRLIATGVGSCSSYESKYRWRKGERRCPVCQVTASVIKGKAEYGGGWLCWKKKGGCGSRFADDDPKITSQEVGDVENTDLAGVKNTILKMAKKRAYTDAIMTATRSSGMFTLDEDAPGVPATEDSASTKPQPRDLEYEEVPPDEPVPPPPPKKAAKAAPKAKAAAPPPPPAPPQANGSPIKKIEPGDLKTFWRIAGSKGWSHTEIGQLIFAECNGLTSTHEIPQSMFAPLVSILERGPNADRH